MGGEREQQQFRVGFEFSGIKYSAPYTLRINKNKYYILIQNKLSNRVTFSFCICEHSKRFRGGESENDWLNI